MSRQRILEARRPALRYHGGKWRLAPWIIGHFPAHRIYVEPFGGAASVLIRKPRSYAEVYNDIDGEIVNLFRVLQNPLTAAALISKLQVTPFARDEFDLCSERHEEPIEAARRLLVRSFMGFGTSGMLTGRRTGFRANSNRSGTTPAADWASLPGAFPAIIERFRGVVIENRPAIQVMRDHDSPQTLHYVDPPYVLETRSAVGAGRGYAHEMTDADHTALLQELRRLNGAVIVSGYAHEIYAEALSDWIRVDKEAFADGARPRTESIWLNGKVSQCGPLFGWAAEASQRRRL